MRETSRIAHEVQVSHEARQPVFTDASYPIASGIRAGVGAGGGATSGGATWACAGEDGTGSSPRAITSTAMTSLRESTICGFTLFRCMLMIGETFDA